MEGPLEERAFARDTVDVRRLHVRMAAGAEFVEAQVVDQDDQKIGFFHRSIPGPPIEELEIL
jgi:hypothetical protein